MRHPLGLVALVVTAMALVGPVPMLAQGSGPPPDGTNATVVDVIDGDTIWVELDDGSVERVRYIGMDAPELTDEDLEGAEPYSRQAALANAAYVAGQDVVLESDVSDRDGLDRLVRYVWVDTEEGWVMVNEQLVALGLAEVTPYEPDTRHGDLLLASEDHAIETGRGMYDPDTISAGLLGAEAMAYLFFDAYEARDVPTLRRVMANDVVYVLPDGQRFRGLVDVVARFREEWAVLDPSVRIRRSIAQPNTAMLDITIRIDTAERAGAELRPETIIEGLQSIRATALQRWPNDRLKQYRLTRD
jgi:micrococcal nuclease